MPADTVVTFGLQRLNRLDINSVFVAGFVLAAERRRPAWEE